MRLTEIFEYIIIGKEYDSFKVKSIIDKAEGIILKTIDKGLDLINQD